MTYVQRYSMIDAGEVESGFCQGPRPSKNNTGTMGDMPMVRTSVQQCRPWGQEIAATGRPIAKTRPRTAKSPEGARGVAGGRVRQAEVMGGVPPTRECCASL